MSIEVETRNVAGRVTALGSAGAFTLTVDRPAESGGGGKGFNGGQLLYLAVAGCVSNDLFRDAPKFDVKLGRVVVRVRGDFGGDPAVSSEVTYDVEVSGEGGLERLRQLIDHVDRIAEIPNTLRRMTEVRLGKAVITDAEAAPHD
jgi:organic hydroperoxide reductase OsmC/OhrA